MAVTFDKKQLPQVLVLGTLSAGLLGYFTLKLLTPPPTQAAAAQATTSSSVPTTDTADADAASGLPDVSALLGAASPTDTMRDPFAAPDQAPATVTAPSPKSGSTIPGLPGLGQVAPLAIPSAAPSWAVTGVICSDNNPAESLAIFRSGDQRRYVRLGEMVDGTTRLIGIDRGGVTVARGDDHIRIALGAAPPEGAPAPGAGVSGASAGPTALPGIPGLPGAGSQTPALPSASAPTLPPLPANGPPPPPGAVPTF